MEGDNSPQDRSSGDLGVKIVATSFMLPLSGR